MVPTICSLMGVDPPKTCQGRTIVEALAMFQGAVPPRKTLMKEMDEAFIDYRKKMTEAARRIENIQPGGRQALLYSSLSTIRQNYYDINRSWNGRASRQWTNSSPVTKQPWLVLTRFSRKYPRINRQEALMNAQSWKKVMSGFAMVFTLFASAVFAQMPPGNPISLSGMLTITVTNTANIPRESEP